MGSLVRYFSDRHARTFVNEGEVLFRSLSYFRDFEDAGVRSDQHEGTLVHRPVDGLKATLVASGETVDVPCRFESTANEDDILVYCMSTELSSDIAQRFGAEVAVEILDPTRFLALMRQKLTLRKRIRASDLVSAPVRYYEWHEPPIVDWALPERIALRKPKSFEWQQEHRVAVPVGDAFRVHNVSVKLVPLTAPKPPRVSDHPEMLLRLGNISKICRIHRL